MNFKDDNMETSTDEINWVCKSTGAKVFSKTKARIVYTYSMASRGTVKLLSQVMGREAVGNCCLRLKAEDNCIPGLLPILRDN